MWHVRTAWRLEKFNREKAAAPERSRGLISAMRGYARDLPSAELYIVKDGHPF
jgi:hypothetical protein